MASNTANLYNGTLTVKGLFPTPGSSVGVTTADTLLSVLDIVAFNTGQRVMMEIGGYNTDVGSFGAIYKYDFGFSNRTSGLGGNFIIEACPVSQSSYSVGTPITLFTLNTVGLNINGTITSTGSFNGNINFNVNTWNTSADGKNRFYFGNNTTMYFGSPNGYEFQNSANSRIAYIDNAGNFSPTGFVNYQINTWNPSADGKNRLYFANNSHTFIGSGDKWFFQNLAGTNVFSITSGGDITAQAITGGALTVTSGAITAGLNVTGQTNLYGNVYSSGALTAASVTATSGAITNGLTVGAGLTVGTGITVGAGLTVTAAANVGTSLIVGTGLSVGAELSVVGNISTSGIFYGNGSGITNININGLFSSSPNKATIVYYSPATSQNTANSTWGGFSGSNPRIYVDISEPIGTYTTTKYLVASGDIYTNMVFTGGGRTNYFTDAPNTGQLPNFSLYVDLTNSSGTVRYTIFNQTFSTDLNGNFGASTNGSGASVGGVFTGPTSYAYQFPGILSVQDTKKNNSINSQMFTMAVFGAYTVKFRVVVNMQMQSGDNGANYTASMQLPTNGPIRIAYE